jgi:hypothetical protein
MACKTRFADHPSISARYLMLPADERLTHSAALALNVLEHIPDHVGALRGWPISSGRAARWSCWCRRSRRRWASFDRAIRHNRRYTTASLLLALDAAGLAVDELRYVNPVGLIGWYVTVKALGMTPRDGLLLRAYDRTIALLRDLSTGTSVCRSANRCSPSRAPRSDRDPSQPLRPVLSSQFAHVDAFR